MKPNIKTILSGVEMSIPVNLISDIIHVSSFNTHISEESFLINSLLAFNVYKYDRYRDASEVDVNDRSEFYDNIIENKNSIEFLLFSSSISIIILLLYYNLNEIIPIYLSSFLYKNIKQLNFPIKPFYVSSLWTISTCIIPEHDSPDLFSCISIFMCIFSMTNLADIKDYEEDIKYNVSSLPTKIGIKNTEYICILSGIMSILSFIIFQPNILFQYQ